MKRIFGLVVIFLLSTATVLATENNLKCPICQTVDIKNNSVCKKDADLMFANKLIAELHKEIEVQIENGYGPFLAAIYDENGKLIAKMPNTVIKENCSLNHAEVNTIREAQRVLGTYDLSPYNLTLYSSAEPCIMCTGAIMWSGIKKVYYGVSSKDVEKITGFDEGYKPDWIGQFKKRNIEVVGNIQTEEGKKAFRKYVETGKHVYKPNR